MPSTAIYRLEGLTTSVAIKAPCRVATTANVALSGEQTIDSLATVTGDRVLVKNQTDGTENGIWVVGTGAWTRARDFDGSFDAVQGTTVFVVNNSAYYRLTTASPAIGTSSLTWLYIGPEIFDPIHVTPQQYGAIGDGVTDDTAAILAAINGGAKTIEFGDNDYLVTGLSVYNKSRLTLRGRGRILMSGTPVNGTHVLTLIQCDNILVEGLTIHGNSETRGGVEGAQNISIYGCTNMTFRHVQSIYSASDGVYLNRAAGSTVINGITMSASSVVSSNIRFEQCLFDYAYRNGATVIACEGYSFPNCVFSNTGKSSAGTTAPSAGVDLEPNDTVQYFPKRGMFQNCRAIGNTGADLVINGRCYETTVDNWHSEGGGSYGIFSAGARTTIRNTLIKDTGAVGGSPRGSILIQSQTGSRASAIIESCEITGAIFGGITVNSYADVYIKNTVAKEGANFGLRYLAGSDPGDANKGFCDVDGLRVEKLFSSSPPTNSAYIMGGSYDGRLHLRKARLLRTGATGTPIEIGVNLATAPPTDVQEISDLNAVGAFATTTAAGFSIARILRNNRIDDVISNALNRVVGFIVGDGGAVTQITSRVTGVTLDKLCGSITLFSAAGTATWQTFTVTNSQVAATDNIRVVQKSGTDLNQIHVTAVAAGSFNISFATTGGTTTEQPVFSFAVIKATAT